MKREAVRPSNERDKWLKRLMPQGTTVAGPCLDAETLAAWADGALSGKALASAEQHVSECSRCLALAAAMQRTIPEPLQSAHDRRALWRWIVPLTAAATAVAIWIVVPQLQHPSQQKPQDQEKLEQTYAAQPRESVPPAAPSASPSAAPEAAREELQAQSGLADESRSARRDAADRRLRKQDDDLKREEETAASNELKETAALSPERAPTQTAKSPAPAPAASADRQAEVDTFGGNVMQRSLGKANVIEAVAENGRIQWRVIDGTDVQRTTDGGQTWIKASSPPSRVVSIREVDALRATVVTSAGSTFTTTDGGATWVLQEKPAAPF